MLHVLFGIFSFFHLYFWKLKLAVLLGWEFNFFSIFKFYIFISFFPWWWWGSWLSDSLQGSGAWCSLEANKLQNYPSSPLFVLNGPGFGHCCPLAGCLVCTKWIWRAFLLRGCPHGGHVKIVRLHLARKIMKPAKTRNITTKKRINSNSCFLLTP